MGLPFTLVPRVWPFLGSRLRRAVVDAVFPAHATCNTVYSNTPCPLRVRLSCFDRRCAGPGPHGSSSCQRQRGEVPPDGEHHQLNEPARRKPFAPEVLCPGLAVALVSPAPALHIGAVRERGTFKISVALLRSSPTKNNKTLLAARRFASKTCALHPRQNHRSASIGFVDRL